MIPEPRALAHALLAALELLVLLRLLVDSLPLRIHGRPTRFIYEASECLLRPLRPAFRNARTGWRDLTPLALLILFAACHLAL